MYLESLEMFGFKSFATKTTLRFHRGVTAIVGPNGCGKSNVLDAMRWVLGEQSAKALRGGEMADVIFGGTDARQPLGMAEVSLTFADCEKDLGVEWNQVQITRRVHRDGKSEYFINKAPCRLRDIHQLFMDTGVGRSAYSIMEQGKIDMILSSRPEDRRSIFEEAAGITKYKAQKKEALRKLDYTEANLVRVQDIIKEVNRQIGSLQRQAAKARRYKALTADLRTFDTHLSHRSYQQIQEQVRTVSEEITQLEHSRAALEGEQAEQQTSLEALRHDLTQQETQIGDLRSELEHLRNREFSARNRIETNTERTSEGRELVRRHQLDISSAEEKTRIQKEQIDEADTQLAAMVEALRSREEELQSYETSLQEAKSARATAEASLREIASTISALDNKLGSLRSEVSLAATRREGSGTRLEVLRNEIESTRQNTTAAANRIEELNNQRDALKLRQGTATQTLEEAKRKREEADKQRQQVEQQYNSTAKEAAGVESKLEVLRQLQQRGEGFDEGTQTLLKGLDNPELYQAAILGPLTESIRVEAELIPAIEAALGPALEAVILKDLTVAQSAVETLARKQKGRAAVLPREWISQPSPNPTTEGQGVLWASSCIDGDSEGADFARSLLASTAIVDSIEQAFVLRASHPALAVVTRRGELIDRTGVIHSGNSGDQGHASALARKLEIEKRESEFQALLQKMESSSLERDRIHGEVEACRANTAAAQEELQSLKVEVASCESELRLAERQHAEQAEKVKAFQRETTQLEENLKATDSRLTELEQSITATAAELEASRSGRSDAETTLDSLRTRESNALEALNEIRVNVATSREQQDSLARQRGPMTARLAELAELMESRKREISRYEQRIAELEQESASLSSSLESLEQEKDTTRGRLDEANAARDAQSSQLEVLETALRAGQKAVVEMQEQKGQLDVRQAQLQMKAENLRTHVSQKYQTEIEDFRPDSYALHSALKERTGKTQPQEQINGESPSPEPPPIPWEQIEEIVAELTQRAESMGPVNLEAIQEYEELDQRQKFLEQQNNDLVRSKAELLEVIGRINRTTKELFSETFVKVRENFQIMYKELFGGGAANLLLVDENDPLESGIEIIAKPPGKQLKSISLLSGGERTMTAVALLFGIYMVKPSPFCVLDEMDAPLDESNISRFIKILDRFVDQSQFVVITHNKRTISRAEMLYGVTMEELGVSKLVSVRFSGGQNEQSVAESFGKDDSLASELEPATTS